MGMRPGDKDIEQEDRAARRQHDAAQEALCVSAVTEWNRLMERRHKPGWSPMIGVALAAKFYFLDVWCPGCRQLQAGRPAQARATPADNALRPDPEAELHRLPALAAIRATRAADQYEWASPNKRLHAPAWNLVRPRS